MFKDAIHTKHGNDLTSALGRFVIAFERVCGGMRSCIIALFHREGLKNQGLSQVIVGKKTSDDLQLLLGALYQEIKGQDNEDRICVKELLADIKKLTETRNILVHSEWHLGNEAGDCELNAFLMKPHLSQNRGAEMKTDFKSQSNLNELIAEATRIQILLERLQICIIQKGFKVSRQFSREL